MSQTADEYLRCTEIIDCHSQAIQDKAFEVTEGLRNDRDKAIALYYFVRDKIKHNAYAELYVLENYKASVILEVGSGICQQKAILLTALARAAGIPARLGFVDVHDNQLSESFKQMIGGIDVFPFHGFAELYIDGKWVHASPAYDIKTCRRKGFVPVDFDGVNDSIDSPYTENGEPHIEHIEYHGPYADFPWDEMLIYYEGWAAKLGMGWEELKQSGESVRQSKSWGQR